MRPGQLRQHARLLRGRYEGQVTEDAEAARAQAEMMIAQSELAEAEAGMPSPAPEEDCTITQEYPIIGEVTRRGGEIVKVAHPWEQSHVDALRARDIDLTWEWCHDPRAGVDQGRLIYIYIGTRSEGPRALWSRSSGAWTSHKSRGNYGKNWACGGNWSSIGGAKSASLTDIAPDLDRAIKEVRDMVDRIALAKARVAAAQKRILACSQRDNAAAARRQAEHPAYPGQEMICIGKAEQIEAFAARTMAEADLIEAEAGISA